jgi:hypothetical protein
MEDLKEALPTRCRMAPAQFRSTISESSLAHAHTRAVSLSLSRSLSLSLSLSVQNVQQHAAGDTLLHQMAAAVAMPGALSERCNVLV